MPRITRNQQPQAEDKQSDIDFIAAALKLWINKRGKALPAPVPIEPTAASAWWMTHMQSPQANPLLARSALLNFLDLPEQDQLFVLAAREDEVHYRGDTPEFFRATYEETMRMRRNTQEYIVKARQRLAHGLSKAL